MYISDYIGINCKGHSNLDFIDVYLDNDNKLFIDPCLLERGTDLWSLEASKNINIYFDCLYGALRNDNTATDSLFEHCHEQNATKLGYGNGKNGKGKTSIGLFDSLSRLKSLVIDIPTISIAQDIPVLVERFAEDCMSDMITNILHDQLNRFTTEQMCKYDRKPDSKEKFWTWNAELSNWEQVTRPCWLYNNKELLLVPKWFVRKNFLFKAHQYLYGVIIERIRSQNDWQDLKKIDIWNNFPRKTEHWEYELVIEYTKEHPDALSEYHQRLSKYYSRAHGCMSDEELDEAVYIHEIVKSA